MVKRKERRKKQTAIPELDGARQNQMRGAAGFAGSEYEQHNMMALSFHAL
jgi:hypothetical protein